MVVYVQDSISWAIGFAIPTVAMAIAIITFTAGSSLYTHVEPTERCASIQTSYGSAISDVLPHSAIRPISHVTDRLENCSQEHLVRKLCVRMLP